MKKIIFLSTLFMALFSMTTSAVAGAEGHCKWESYFKYPKKNQYFEYGKQVKVCVVPNYGHKDIKYMELRVDGKFIRKESKFPYEWYNDQKLRHLSPGKHRLECRIYTYCGFYKTIECWIKIGEGHGGGGHEQVCQFTNPFSLNWCGKFSSGYKVCVYKIGHKKYVRVERCKDGYITWFDCYGKALCHSDNHHLVRSCVYVKCYSNCDFTGGGNNQHCDYKAKWYCKSYASGHGYYKLYVKVNPYKYQDIASMTLFLNGKKVRTENSYPYEWGKGGDYLLKNMKPGYYKLKCVIITKCGHKEPIYKEIKIGHVS